MTIRISDPAVALAEALKRPVCPNGHRVTEDNTRVSKRVRGGWQYHCRDCERLQTIRRSAAQLADRTPTRPKSDTATMNRFITLRLR